MRGLTINGLHTGNDLDMVMHTYKYTRPTPKTSTVSVPGASKVLDFTECFGDVPYNNGAISAEFEAERSWDDFIALKNELVNRFHGRIVQIVSDDTTDYYYRGRAQLDGTWSPDRGCGVITLAVDCEPFQLKKFITEVSYVVGTQNSVNICPPFALWNDSTDFKKIDAERCELYSNVLIFSPYIPVTGGSTVNVSFEENSRFDLIEYNSAKTQVAYTSERTESSMRKTVEIDTRYIRVRMSPFMADTYPVTYSKPFVYLGTSKKEYSRYNNGKLIYVDNARMRTTPRITVTETTSLIFGNNTASISRGTFVVPGFNLGEGCNLFEVDSATNGKTIKLTYQEGML